MGCKYFEKGDDKFDVTKRPSRKGGQMPDFISGDVKRLESRAISEETCAKWGYTVGKWSDDRTVQIAPYFKDGALVGQKVRFPGKDFKVIGKIGDCLFGQNLWGSGGNRIVITEGEIDAMSVSQMQDNRWPVVSVPNGAQGAKGALAANIEWLSGFKEVVLMFDNDEPGRAATEECAALFPPGKVKVAKLPLKDANDMLKAGRVKETITAIWEARAYRPDGLVTTGELKAGAKQPIEPGIPWFFESLTKATFGRRRGQVFGLGAGTGTGKTDFIVQQMSYDVSLGYKPVAFLLEQPPLETLVRLAGKLGHKAFHVPDGSWTEEERNAAIDAVSNDITLYDSFGAADWDVIKNKIRYMALNEDAFLFYIDHLTALADPSNERESLEKIMAELAALAKELGVWILYVSHLTTPEGKSHEEGGRVAAKHFKGARAIQFWSHFMAGIERNQQAEDPEERRRSLFRLLKDRFTGRATGYTFHFTYDPATTHLVECAGPDKHGFKDESTGDF